MVSESEQNKAKKAIAIEKIYELLGQHKQILLADFTNVGSNQIQLIRKMLRPYKGQLVISKNTLIKKVLKMRIEGIKEDEFKHLAQQHGGVIPELKALVPQLKDKIALIFCDSAVFDLKKKIEANKIPTEARVGAMAPINYTVPAGPTGLDPSQINFFHALNISTKIVKGQIQITKDFKVCTANKKVKASEAALLKKLNIKPFEYGMKLNGVYSSGAILPQAVLDIDPSSLLGKFQNGVKNIVGLSISSGITVEAAIPHVLANSFRNIAALSLESGFVIKELASLVESKPAQKKEEKPKEVKKQTAKPVKEEPKEAPKQEQDQGGMGGLFD